MSKANRYLEAFKESYNVVGLAGAAALSAALLNPLPLLAGLVAEAAYLLFVPDTKWYESRLSARHDAEIAERRRRLKERILPELSAEMQSRFTRLEATRAQIEAHAKKDERWFREVLRKLDYLLEKFLHFGSREAQFRAYLQSVLDENGPSKTRRAPRYERYWEKNERNGNRQDRQQEKNPRSRRIPINEPPPPAAPPEVPRGLMDRWANQTVAEIQSHYQDDIDALRGLIENEGDANTRAVLEKRADVLEQRHEHVGKLGRILINPNHQLELLEDTFGLINDQIRARSPEQVLADIESVVWQTDSMTKLLDEIAPYERMSASLEA